MKILPKMKALYCSQFSHYKSIEIFSDVQGQLTQLLVMGSGRNSNSFKLLWLSLLPARHPKIKALDCSQFSHDKSMKIFQMFKGS